MDYNIRALIEMFLSVGGVCIVLPIWIVTLVMKARTRKMDRKMDILMKAVESGQQVDPALLVTAEQGDGKYRLKKNLLNRLCVGIFLSIGGLLFGLTPLFVGLSYSNSNVEFLMISAVVFSVGIGFLVSYFVGRKMLAKEIEAEEAELAKK